MRGTNRANLLLNLLSRGATLTPELARTLGLPPGIAGPGSAILPYYMGGEEKNLGQNAAAVSQAIQALSGSPELAAADYQRILNQYSPGLEASRRFGMDLASGQMTDQMLSEAQPVFEARTTLATGRKNAALEALRSTLNDIDALQAQKGYAGDSLGNRLMKFKATQSIMGGAADTLNAALLQNAIEKAGLQTQGRNLRLSNINLPDTLARSDLARTSLPGETVARNFQTSLSPMNFFNLGPHAFTPFQTPPIQGAQPSSWQLMAQAGAGAGNMAANYFLNKNLAEENAAKAQQAAKRDAGYGGGGGGPTPEYYSGPGTPGPMYGGYDAASM